MCSAVACVQPVLPDQYTYRVTITGTSERNVCLAMTKTFIALVDQNAGKSLALCFVASDGVTQRQRKLPTNDGHAFGSRWLEVKFDSGYDKGIVCLAIMTSVIGIGHNKRHLDSFVHSSTTVASTTFPDFLDDTFRVIHKSTLWIDVTHDHAHRANKQL